MLPPRSPTLDAKPPLSRYVRLRIRRPWSMHQCPYQNLLILPTLLLVACLIGRNHGWSQFQQHESSFEPWTFLGHWKHSLLLFSQFHTTSKHVLCTKSLSRSVLRIRFKFKNVLCTTAKPRNVLCIISKPKNVLCTKCISQNVLCIRSEIVLYNEINRSELVNAHNYLILNIDCNQVVFLSKPVMAKLYNLVQIPSCFLPKLT